MDWVLVCLVFWSLYLCVNVQKARFADAFPSDQGVTTLPCCCLCWVNATNLQKCPVTRQNLNLKTKSRGQESSASTFLLTVTSAPVQIFGHIITENVPLFLLPSLPVSLSAHRGRLSSTFQGPPWAGGAPCSDEPVGLVDDITHTLAQSVIIEIYHDPTFTFAVLSINCLLCSHQIS